MTGSKLLIIASYTSTTRDKEKTQFHHTK